MANIKKYLLLGFNIVTAEVDRSPSNQGTDIWLTLEKIDDNGAFFSLGIGVNILKGGEIYYIDDYFDYQPTGGDLTSHPVKILDSFIDNLV